jgi:RNA polymerase sigma-70 factor, ECF subfamily
LNGGLSALIVGAGGLYDEICKSCHQFVLFNSMPTAWPDKDDHELLELIQSGSGQAFAVLVERHTERFYRLAYRYLQSKEAAEDAIQDAFLKLWENPALWQPERNSKFTTWFYRVVVNQCLDLRKRKAPVALDEEMPLIDDREAVDELMMQAQEQKLLEREIAALPERQQTALNLCFDEGLSNQEAAEIMGVRLKALQSLIMRAKTTLKERMKAYLT